MMVRISSLLWLMCCAISAAAGVRSPVRMASPIAMCCASETISRSRKVKALVWRSVSARVAVAHLGSAAPSRRSTSCASSSISATAMFSVQVVERGGSGDQQHVVSLRERPRQRHLRGGDPARAGDLGDDRVAEHVVVDPRGAERKVGDERHAVGAGLGDDVGRAAVGHAVQILYLRDVGQLRGLAVDVEADGADADAADLARILELLQRPDQLGERDLRADVRDAEIDDVDPLDPERGEVVVHVLGQLAALNAGGQPPSASRRAPTLVASTRSSGYGCSAARISSLETSGP